MVPLRLLSIRSDVYRTHFFLFSFAILTVTHRMTHTLNLHCMTRWSNGIRFLLSYYLFVCLFILCANGPDCQQTDKITNYLWPHKHKHYAISKANSINFVYTFQIKNEQKKRKKRCRDKKIGFYATKRRNEQQKKKLELLVERKFRFFFCYLLLSFICISFIALTCENNSVIK